LSRENGERATPVRAFWSITMYVYDNDHGPRAGDFKQDFKNSGYLLSRQTCESRFPSFGLGACFLPDLGEMVPVISLDRRVSNLFQGIENQWFDRSTRGAARPESPCWQGKTGRIPVLAKLSCGARRETTFFKIGR